MILKQAEGPGVRGSSDVMLLSLGRGEVLGKQGVVCHRWKSPRAARDKEVFLLGEDPYLKGCGE